MSLRGLKRFATSADGALAVLLLVTIGVMGALNPTFFQPANMLEMSRFFVETGLIALAMTPIIITGGIHAREWISPSTCMYLADTLLGGPNLWVHLPIYIIGPVVGAVAAAFLYDWLTAD